MNDLLLIPTSTQTTLHMEKRSLGMVKDQEALGREKHIETDFKLRRWVISDIQHDNTLSPGILLFQAKRTPIM